MKWYCKTCSLNINGECTEDVFNPISLEDIKFCRNTLLSSGKYKFKRLVDVMSVDPEYIKDLVANNIESLAEHQIKALKEVLPYLLNEEIEKTKIKLNKLKQLKQIGGIK